MSAPQERQQRTPAEEGRYRASLEPTNQLLAKSARLLDVEQIAIKHPAGAAA